MDYYSNSNNYSYSSHRYKDYSGKKSYSNQGKSNHISYRDKFDSPKRQSLFVKLGMDLVQNQPNHEEGSSNIQAKNQQKLMELPVNFKKNNLISNSIDNLNGKSFHNYFDKENENFTNSNKGLKKNVEFNSNYKKPFKKKNKNYYNSNIDGAYDYEQIHEQSITYDHEEVNQIKFIGEESITYIMINFSETLLDLYYGIDSRHNTLINSNKYLNLLKEEILNKNTSIELFNNDSMNKSFSNALKLSAIFMIIIKYTILDFQYENNLKSLLRKVLKSISEFIVHSLDMFILNPLVNLANSISYTTQDKFVKFIKQNKQLKKSTNSELLIFYSKSNELSANFIKQISISYFKVGFFRPIHNIIYHLITSLDKYTFTNLIKLIFNNILYSYLTPYNHYNKQLYQNTYLQNYVSSMPNLPYLPPIKDYNYTLVLDLDETLVHFFYTPSGGSFLIRPYCMEFLESLSSLYEIVIFTAALKDYADTILDKIDREFQLIKFRLYRNHTQMTNSGVVKVRFYYIRDLSKIGRDLSKVIIIDNLPENFRLQNNNGLPIITWTDNMRDTQLRDLSIILEDIYKNKVTDVRVIIKRLKDEILKSKNVNNPYFKIDISKLM